MFPLRDDNPRHGPALVTWALLGINVAVFLYQATLTPAELYRFLFDHGFVPGQFIRNPLAEAPALVTTMFIHGGFWHLVGNMFFLGVFGDNVEDRLGHGRYLVFYLLGGVVATLAHAFLSGASQLPLVGASGAISALLGAYILLYPRMRVLTFIAPFVLPWLLLRAFARVPRFYLAWFPAWLYLGYWALIQFLEATGGTLAGGDVAGGVAWWAHVGGFLFGLLTVRRFGGLGRA